MTDRDIIKEMLDRSGQDYREDSVGDIILTNAIEFTFNGDGSLGYISNERYANRWE